MTKLFTQPNTSIRKFFGFESERSIGTAILTIIEQPIPIQKWLLVAHFEDGINMIS